MSYSKDQSANALMYFSFFLVLLMPYAAYKYNVIGVIQAFLPVQEPVAFGLALVSFVGVGTYLMLRNGVQK